MNEKWQGPSEKDWNKLIDDVEKMRISLIGDLGSSNNESLSASVHRLITVVHGPSNRPERGIESRTEVLENSFSKAYNFGKGAIAVWTIIGGLIVFISEWVRSLFIHKP